jgi:hypothetical protein
MLPDFFQNERPTKSLLSDQTVQHMNMGHEMQRFSDLKELRPPPPYSCRPTFQAVPSLILTVYPP